VRAWQAQRNLGFQPHGGAALLRDLMLRSRVASLLDPRKRILVAGEMILDEFIWGKVSRISPEAPVPVVDVVSENWCAGGAANVARNLRELCDDVHLLSLAGTDRDAEVLRGLLGEAGIRLDCVLADAAYRTIRKTRIIARTQQVVRVDREQRTTFSEAQRAAVVAKFDALLPQLDAVILEDYDKGLLDQPLADALTQRARAAGKIVCVDPKPSNAVQWRGVTCVTPNRPEAFRCAGVPLSDPIDPPIEDAALREVGAILLEKWQCDVVLVTLSEQGMMLFERGAQPWHIPTRAVEVFDVSGAGDTAIAVFTAALAGGATAREAAEVANHASGIVVGKLGTAVVHREELLGSFGED
jgi:D-beta-D-heptose 7-phosphate kinase/D-beta-D-heptose 1-phosphate adenosyltransferase